MMGEDEENRDNNIPRVGAREKTPPVFNIPPPPPPPPPPLPPYPLPLTQDKGKGKMPLLPPSQLSCRPSTFAAPPSQVSCRPSTSAAPPAPAKEEEERVYPIPGHSHEMLIRNKKLFDEVLKSFHSEMDTKYMVPVIGGKELDIHRLYVEVTERGGLEKVIVERKWRDVILGFNFPPTTTSASYVLRKYYLSLLHHFEQVYFFRLQGPLVPPAAALQTRSPTIMQDKPRGRKRAFRDTQGQGLPAPTAPREGTAENFKVMGRIDGKFENGYLVSIELGSRTLHGVLYHCPNAGVPSPSVGTVSDEVTVPFFLQRDIFRRRKGWKSRESAHPKPNRSPYNFYFADEYARLKDLYPNKDREFSRMIGESWSKLTEEEKEVYVDIGKKDKERYRLELQQYKDSLKFS